MVILVIDNKDYFKGKWQLERNLFFLLCHTKIDVA